MLTHSPKHSTGSPLGEKAPRQHPAPYRSPRPPHSLRRARKDEPAAGPKGGPPQGGARRRVPRRSHRLLPPGRCRHPSGQHPPRRAGPGSVGRDGAVRGPVTHRVRPAGGGGEPRAGRGAPQRVAGGQGRPRRRLTRRICCSSSLAAATSVHLSDFRSAESAPQSLPPRFRRRGRSRPALPPAGARNGGKRSQNAPGSHLRQDFVRALPQTSPGAAAMLSAAGGQRRHVGSGGRRDSAVRGGLSPRTLGT